MFARNLRLIAVGAAAILAIAGAVLVAGGGGRGPISVPGPSPTRTAVAAATGEIAFDREVDGNRDIYIMNVDGTGLERLTTDSAVELEPNWSPDGRVLLFTRVTEPDVSSAIVALDMETRVETYLTASSGSDGAPRYSPDGTLIAFGHGPDAPGTYVMSADGSNAHNVAPFAGDSRALIGWASPASLLESDGPNTLLLVYITSGEVSTFRTDLAGEADNGSLSSDGTQLAFKGETASTSVFVSNLDGTGRREIAPSTHKGAVIWSPDGQHLAFFGKTGDWWSIVGLDGGGLIAEWAQGGGSAAWRPAP